MARLRGGGDILVTSRRVILPLSVSGPRDTSRRSVAGAAAGSVQAVKPVAAEVSAWRPGRPAACRAVARGLKRDRRSPVRRTTRADGSTQRTRRRFGVPPRSRTIHQLRTAEQDERTAEHSRWGGAGQARTERCRAVQLQILQWAEQAGGGTTGQKWNGKRGRIRQGRAN